MSSLLAKKLDINTATLVDAFANQVDEFFGGDWHAYRKQVEAAKMSWFRE